MPRVNDEQMLNYISKTGEMGVNSIMHVLRYPLDSSIRKQLKEQQQEYGEIYTKARTMLRRRGRQPKNLSRPTKMAVGMKVRQKMMFHPDTAKVAEMVIRGNTMGLNKSVDRLHQYSGNNQNVRALAVKLMRTEKSNIESLRSYL